MAQDFVDRRTVIVEQALDLSAIENVAVALVGAFDPCTRLRYPFLGKAGRQGDDEQRRVDRRHHVHQAAGNLLDHVVHPAALLALPPDRDHRLDVKHLVHQELLLTKSEPRSGRFGVTYHS